MSVILKAVIASVLYFVFLSLFNMEMIREKVEDFAFDSINQLWLDSKEEDVKSPKIYLIEIDNLYLKDNNLTNGYGYHTPRKELTKIIQNINKIVKVQKESKIKPIQSLFIDTDLSFTSMPYGKELNEDDIELIKVLNSIKEYKILIPKVYKYNFLEQHITNKNIIFVSVGLIKNSDTYNRRWQAYKVFDDKVYLNASLVQWLVSNNHTLKEIENIKLNSDSSIDVCGYNFKQKDIVENRIIFKLYKKDGKKISADSFWNKLEKVSASKFDSIKNIKRYYSDSILILGSNNNYNEDTFAINSSNETNTPFLKGSDLHANALMTLFYLNGTLKPYSLIYSMIIIFIIYLITFFCTKRLINKYEKFKKVTEFIDKVSAFSITTIFLIIMMFSISIFILEYNRYWFNWTIPLFTPTAYLLFYLLINILKKIFIMIKNNFNFC